MFRFAVGMLKYPMEIPGRLRELSRIATAPSVDQAIQRQQITVSVVEVKQGDDTASTLVDIFRRNPSPFVTGPRTLDELGERLERGIRHFLVLNEAGEAVGARCFDPTKKMLFNSVTDFSHRGHGYQLSASTVLRSLLVEEGFREFRGAVMKSNTRMQRALKAAGWVLSPDENNPDILRATLTIED